MRIGIDCDEPLADIIEGLVTYLNSLYKTTFTKHDHKRYDLTATWGGTKQEALQNIMDFYRTHHFTNTRPTKGSVEAVKYLCKDHDLYVITSRPKVIAAETKEWLETNYPGCFKEIYFSNELNRYISPKIKGPTEEALCKSLNIDLYIEDHIGFAEKIVAADIPVLLFTAPWNKFLKNLPTLMFRVNSWKDILDHIILSSL